MKQILCLIVGIILVGCNTAKKEVSTPQNIKTASPQAIKYYESFESAMEAGDGENAKKYLDLSCDENYDLGCFASGMLYAEAKNYNAAYDKFLKGCNDLNHGASCNQLAVLQLGSNDKKLSSLGLETMDKACKLNDPYACLNMAEIYGGKGGYVSPNSQKQNEYLTKSCALGVKQACK